MLGLGLVAWRYVEGRAVMGKILYAPLVAIGRRRGPQEKRRVYAKTVCAFSGWVPDLTDTGTMESHAGSLCSLWCGRIIS